MKNINEVEGQIDGIAGQGLSGWAWRPSRPEEHLWIELVVDGCSMGIGRADHFHPSAPEDGCHGFWIPLPGALLEEPVELNAVVANTGETFAPYQLLKPANQSTTKLSQVYGDGGLRLTGWAMDQADPKRIVHVSAWLKGKRIATVAADRRCLNPGQFDGHGFDITLPFELADGEGGLVEILDDSGMNLGGSPVFVETFSHKAAGWLKSSHETPDGRLLLKHLLDSYERVRPGSVGFSCYTEWKKTFAPPAPAVSTGGIGICHADDSADKLQRAASENRAVLLMASCSELLPSGLEQLAAALDESGAALVYGDSEASGDNGVQPLFKPAWDPYLFCGQDYLGSLLVDSRVIKSTPFPAEEKGLPLRTRLILAAEGGGISHLPLPVSRDDGSMPTGEEREARRKILLERFSDCAGSVELLEHPELPHLDRLRFHPASTPLVSIIIPTRDRAELLAKCLDSLWHSAGYSNMEIIVIDNGSVEDETLRLFQKAKKKGTRILPCHGQFNYSAMNNQAAREAKGEMLCFLNNDTEAITPDWLMEMVSLLQQPDVGCVGAKLLWPTGVVQHGGVVVGTHQLAGHVGNSWTGEMPGYHNRNQLVQQWSAVTAACMLTERSLFIDTGGFDPVLLPVSFNDTDYCLRLREHGKKILWTPWARLSHHESASRGKDATPAQKARTAMEESNFRSKWGQYDDPFYNPNLTLSTLDQPFGGLALPPRERKVR